MKIINLRAENIKKLTAIDITPKDDVILITGENGAGKSSVLDCITWALKGGREIQEEPIKHGEDKGKIMLDLGDYVILRSFTKNSTTLQIRSKEGAVQSSPQKLLDKIVGNISFDPLDFMNNDKKKQREIFLNLIGVDTTTLDKEEKDLREERLLIGRQKDQLIARHKEMPEWKDVKGEEEISILSISKQLQDAIKTNSDIDTFIQDNENIKSTAMLDVERKKELEKELADLNLKINNAKLVYQSNKEKISTMVKIDTTPIEDSMATLETTNSHIRDNKEKARVKLESDAAVDNYEGLTKRIDETISKRKKLLEKAPIPVPGLSFNDGELLYNDIPLGQASDGEKLMISLSISMALNPTLKVLRIKDGSLLDAKNRTIISKQVKDKGYQLWYESVGSDSKVGIVIEEGNIISVDGQPAESKKYPRGNAKVVKKEVVEDPKEESDHADPTSEW
jgi:DNA repair exonuclease SbcCD ATPase subunit